MQETDPRDAPKQAHSNVAYIVTPKRPDTTGFLVFAVAFAIKPLY